VHIGIEVAGVTDLVGFFKDFPRRRNSSGSGIPPVK
jgi:hypothetical protein